MINYIKGYFSEFKVLKTASKEFWLVNGINFFDCLAYFSMINVLSLYLTSNIGFSDMDSGAWVGIYTLYITAFIFAVGSIADTIGLKKSFYIGIGILMLSRLALGVLPLMLKGEALKYGVMGAIVVMSFGTAFMSPIVTMGLRKFTTKENRSTGFNVYYLIMNVAAIFAGFAVTDGFRNWLGEIKGNMAILDFGFIMSLGCMVLAYFINEANMDASEMVKEDAETRPLKIFKEVWKESAFRKLVLFLVLTLGVRLVFTNQFLVMPKYYTRVLYADYDLGFANSINPAVIIVGLIVLIPILNKFKTFNLMVWGMGISALSLISMSVPIEWIMKIPGITNLNQAYMFAIYAQILIFAFGELLFSPRFVEYTSMVAPKDKVASYMSLSALPMFIAKPINGFIGGALVAAFSYEGIRPKIDAGHIGYFDSPEYMWLIYFAAAIISPVAILWMKKMLTSEHQRIEDEKNAQGSSSGVDDTKPIEA